MREFDMPLERERRSPSAKTIGSANKNRPVRGDEPIIPISHVVFTYALLALMGLAIGWGFAVIGAWSA